jgi:epoxyqueuosine reductase
MIFTNLALGADSVETDHCGTCQKCLDICPTRAFLGPYRLDARRCISYLTIEHKGPIPRELRPLLGNRIYGCDDCLAVCPWNKFSHATSEPTFLSRPDLVKPRLAMLVGLDDTAFRRFFSGSPIKRIGRNRFIRNVLYAIGNSNRADLIPSLLPLLTDDAPLVRGAAVWALQQVSSPEQLLKFYRKDDDDSVNEEWDHLAS